MSVEAKLDRAMPSRRQFSCKRVQSRTCSGYAERSRKCQEKVHVYEGLVELCVKCLEGTTERSDSNRGRSPRIVNARTMCLEGTTPQDLHYKHRHRRTAFQAHRALRAYPGASYPALLSLRSALALHKRCIYMKPKDLKTSIQH